MTTLLYPGPDHALTLVASTYNPNECGRFTISAHSKEQITLELLESY